MSRVWMRFLLGSFARFTLIAIALAGLVWLLSFFARGSVRTTPPGFSQEDTQAAEQMRDARFDKDVAKHPTVYRDVKVEPAQQSPVLDELVASGELPPLKERLPKEPVVMEGPDGIGKYGGTWIRFANTELDISVTLNSRLAGPYLCRWSPLGYPIVPHVAKAVVPSADRKVWTIYLRPGMRWSNGDPYSADDIMYWWNEEVLNPQMANGTVGDWLTRGGALPKFEKVDDYTVRVTFAEPNALFQEVCASRLEMSGLPSHYLRQYHPDPAIGNAAIIKRDMIAFKQANPRALYAYMKRWQNPDLPSIWPWIYRTERPTPPQVFVRNPYYFAVDAAGNQLPYIDRLQFEVKDQEMMTIAVANGQATMQDRNLDFSDYTEFMSRRESAGTRVLHWYPATRQNWVINPNSNRKVFSGDNVTRQKAALLEDKRFRQALSIAINRPEIIKAEYFGVGTPSQVSPGDMSPFDNPDLAQRYTQFDPATANRMLDELGLTQRDYEGFRTFPDGTRMTFFLDYTSFTGPGPAQFVVDDWKAVGVRVTPRMLSRLLFYNNKGSCDFDFCVWSSESDFVPLLMPRLFVTLNSESFYATAWGRWFYHGGLNGDPRAVYPGAIEPPPGSPMRKALELYQKAIRTVDQAGQIALFRKIEDIATENLWTIGISTAPPVLVVVDKHLKNVPEHALVGLIFSNPSNCGLETFFFDNARPNLSADAQIRSSLYSAVHHGSDQHIAPRSLFENVMQFLLIGICIAAAIMLALRHPLVGRRLAIMVPMLLIISIIVFTIMRLPQTDFITTQIASVEASGDATSARRVEDMQRMFHTGDPAWLNYCRWMGFKWFISFNAEDEGLLQGNLGRSMETMLPINDVVTERMLLTLLVGVVAAIAACAIGIPLGIYSAVRQHTAGEHLLTLIAFAAMSVPPFLLALILVAWTNTSGLHSAQFSADAGDSSARFFDLLKHLWIPIFVLASGSAAYMIRIMRANLLDELGKPYVLAARARGMRPLQLLIKYPVRIALNPFISSLGGQFTLLLSGGAVVGIVLSLPMISPYLIDALSSQDTYLAGSLLMLLALFGAFGTLVSDLLLLRLDPRIRLLGEMH